MTDELQAVRELLAEQAPPGPEVIAAARARWSGSAGAQGWPGWPGSAARTFRRRGWRGGTRRRRVLVRGGLIAAAAAVAAAALAVVAIGPPAAGLGVFRLPPASAGVRPGTAAGYGPGRAVLLTAARTVARGGPGGTGAARTGRYWVFPAEVGNFLRAGPPGDHYVILERVANDDWSARSPRSPSPDVTQALGVQLATASGRAAWHRDGSPVTWDIGQDTALAEPHGFADGFGFPISAAAGPPTASTVSGGSQPFWVGGQFLSAAQLRALPADPARLRALILTGGGDGDSTASYLFQATPAVLAMPVTPAVRAALYQMLAGLPGVRSLGPVRDVGGRSGVAVAISGRYSHCGYEDVIPDGGTGFAWTFASCVVQEILVISPRTGLPLAQELRYLRLPPGQSWPVPGRLFSFELFGTAHWTDASPPAS